MSLKELSKNLQTEDEIFTFKKKERVIRRPLSLHHLHKDMADIIRSHKHEEERKSNVQAYMTNYFLHYQYSIINKVCNKAMDIVKSLQVKKFNLSHGAPICLGYVNAY